jgi:hypothetical protein
MLDKPVDGIVIEDGRVVGVRSGADVVKCKQVSIDFIFERKMTIYRSIAIRHTYRIVLRKSVR